MKSKSYFKFLLLTLIFFPPSVLTQIHEAIKKQNQPEIDAFINDKKADLEAGDMYGRTVLHIAFKQKDIPTAKRLIEKDANINAQDHNDWTPGHVVAKTGDIESFQILIDSNANLRTKDIYGRTVLHIMVRERHLNIIQMYAKEISHLLDIKDVSGMTSLHIASKSGDTLIVEELLKLGADVLVRDKWERMAFHLAIQEGHLDIVQMFVKKNIALLKTITGSGYPVLHLATQFGQTKVVTLFVKKLKISVYDRNAYGWPPILIAIKNGHIDTAKQLIKLGAYLKTTLRNAQTAAHIVAKSSLVDNEMLLEWLIKQGIDVQAKDQYGQTPHDLARQQRNIHLLPLLNGESNSLTTNLTTTDCRKVF